MCVGRGGGGWWTGSGEWTGVIRGDRICSLKNVLSLRVVWWRGWGVVR